MSRPLIAPSLMCMSMMNVAQDLRAMDHEFDLYHVDIMDAHFCPNMALTPAFANELRRNTRVRERYGLKYRIQLDGQCNVSTFATLYDSGADVLVVGNSGLFSLDPELPNAIREFKTQFLECTGVELQARARRML